MIWSKTPVASAMPYRSGVGGFCAGSTMKLSAVHLDKNRHSYLGLSRTGPQLSNNFRGSIHISSTCFPRLPTFVSSGRRVQLLGCWLGFARGRIYTFWIASTDFTEKPLSNPNSYVTLHDILLLLKPQSGCRKPAEII